MNRISPLDFSRRKYDDKNCLLHGVHLEIAPFANRSFITSVHFSLSKAVNSGSLGALF